MMFSKETENDKQTDYSAKQNYYAAKRKKTKLSEENDNSLQREKLKAKQNKTNIKRSNHFNNKC